MQRLLTGYATAFNIRHHRHGHLFQNRYKSILCQEETYLLELVRYIHLNPLRAGIVPSFKILGQYRYSGHRYIIDYSRDLTPWMAIEEVMLRFSANLKQSLNAYQDFVKAGIEQGKRSDLTGGGLVRSAGGWRELSSAREAGIFLKSDERILGDSDFVGFVLESCEEEFERKSNCHRNDLDLEKLITVVARTLNIETDEVCAIGKHPRQVQARSLLSYWAVRELGLTATAMAKQLQLTQPAVTLAVSRGQRLAAENKLIILWASPWPRGQRLAAENGWLLKELLKRNL